MGISRNQQMIYGVFIGVLWWFVVIYGLWSYVYDDLQRFTVLCGDLSRNGDLTKRSDDL